MTRSSQLKYVGYYKTVKDFFYIAAQLHCSRPDLTWLDPVLLLTTGFFANLSTLISTFEP